MKHFKTCILVLFYSLLATVTYSQVTVHVITKTITKTISIGDLNKFQITAERADIEVVGWDKNEIAYEVKLSAKHPEKAVAESELKNLAFLSQKIGKTYFLRNYILLKKGDKKPTSNFAAQYIVHIPKAMILEISNSFGKVDLEKISGDIKLDLKFCQSIISNCTSNVRLGTYFGNTTILAGVGNLYLKSDHTEYTIKQHRYNLEANIEFGTFYYEFMPNNQLIDLEVWSSVMELNSSNWSQTALDMELNKVEPKMSSVIKVSKKTARDEKVYQSNSTAKTKLKIEQKSGSLILK
jgi:hypothetical protein